MKKALPIIIVLLIVVGGVVIGSQVLLKKEGQITPEGGLQQEVPAQKEEKGFTGKLKDALSLGQSMKCTWKIDEDNFATGYIKSNKIYSETNYEGKKMYSIVANNCVYSWEEGTDQGFKFCSEPGEPEEIEMPEEFSWETPDIDYSCIPAVVSDTMFNPPTNINFISPEEMLPEGFEDLMP